MAKKDYGAIIPSILGAGTLVWVSTKIQTAPFSNVQYNYVFLFLITAFFMFMMSEKGKDW